MAARRRIEIALAKHMLMVLALAIALAACGGGGGGAPIPPVVFPPAVDEITDADLTAAGVPALPLAVSAVSSTSGRRASFALECWTSGTPLHASDAISVHNLTTTTTGFVTDVPADTTSRIIAWAMFKLPGAVGDHARSLVLDGLSGDDQVRLFAAVGNFSAGRWEPIGHIAVDPSDPSGNTFTLSPGPRYNRAADGAAYFLLLVGHPGNGNMSGYKIEFTDIVVTSLNAPCANEGFAEGTRGAIDWGDGQVDYSGTTRVNDGVLRMRQKFETQQSLLSGGREHVLLFPQPLDLTNADGTDWFFFQSLMGDYTFDGAVDAADYAFYDPAEVNGARHPYRLGIWDDTDIVHAVGAIPLSESSDGGSGRSLIGLLIPAAAGVTVALGDVHGDQVRSDTTDAKGRFELPDINQLAEGDYTVHIGPDVRSFRLMEEEGIFYFLAGSD